MPFSEQQFHLIVIGGGLAGEGAIDEAHRSGYSAAIVERGKVGGDCSQYACLPTKLESVK